MRSFRLFFRERISDNRHVLCSILSYGPADSEPFVEEGEDHSPWCGAADDARRLGKGTEGLVYAK